MLYMSAVSAVRWNPTLRTVFDQLIQKGKPTKVALVACMRKLLVYLNARVRDQIPWHVQPAPWPTLRLAAFSTEEVGRALCRHVVCAGTTTAHPSTFTP